MEDEHDVKLGVGNGKNRNFFGIYDGHSGNKAAEWCAKHLCNYVENLDVLNQETISKSMVEADKAFLNSGIDVLNGTTVVFAITELTDDNSWNVTVANLGDSRCIIGNYSNPNFKCMTTDHKPTDEEETKRVIAAGGVVMCKRVDGLLAVSRSIGDGTYKDNAALPPEKQKVIPIPDITKIELNDDNFIFICCDGIFESFTNDEAMKFIYEKSKTTEDICEILSELLFAVLTKGSKDNMSAMIVRKKSSLKTFSTQEFEVGEFFENGTDIYMEAYKRNCERYDMTLEQAIKIWEEKKKLIEKKKTEGLTLEILKSKYVKTENLASVALHSAFFGDKKGKK